jgi:hypothetical protein
MVSEVVHENIININSKQTWPSRVINISGNIQNVPGSILIAISNNETHPRNLVVRIYV